MAERRMFSKTIIGSGKFLRMPPTSRLLYYDLGMMADDDGVVEAYTVMTSTKATEDDLRVLVAKGFVKVLNEDLVTYITDWHSNNTIRADRYHESIYKDLVLQLGDNQLTTKWQPNDNQMETEVRLGKVRLDEGNNIAEAKPTKHKYGEYNNVLLTDEELEKLKADYPDIDERIERLSEYIASKGAKYKSHYATIRSWAKKDKPKTKPNAFTSHEQTKYDFDELERILLSNG